MSTIRKRFIAAAVCPHCQQVDTLAIWIENQIEQCQCIKCGYQQSQSEVELKQHIRPQEQLVALFPLKS
ncbi:YheV family putative zinc ribbon protein [Serratia microhaemolytica]|uniref:YheV family putative zinc ribbon protein n=1 Tax=Serratia microhaemolytica TaxID=2675110 RepID=UPI000FDF44A6|nr:YheV family putative zinc ribbon protein [Serratia microhaemolytica]